MTVLDLSFCFFSEPHYTVGSVAHNRTENRIVAVKL